MPRLSRSALRRRIHTTAAIAATMVTLSLAACSDDDSGASTNTTGSTTSDSSTQEQGTWPRSVDSLVVDNGTTTKDTEKVEIPAKPEKIVSTAVTLTGTLLAVDAPVIASGGAKTAGTDENGFFNQWAGKAVDQGVKPLWSLDVNLQKVAAEDPDLILVSAAGADTAAPQVDELKKIGAPVIVVDYSNQTWTDLTTQIGEITGHEKEAARAITTYQDRITEVTQNIHTPEQPVNVVLPSQDGALNYMTAESAQGQIITDLNWELNVPREGIFRTDGAYAGRTDVKQVTAENGDKGLVGKTVFGINVDGATPVLEVLKKNPLLLNTYALKNNRVFELSPSAFRIDYFSAMEILDQIDTFFSER